MPRAWRFRRAYLEECGDLIFILWLITRGMVMFFRARR